MIIITDFKNYIKGLGNLCRRCHPCVVRDPEIGKMDSRLRGNDIERGNDNERGGDRYDSVIC